MSPALFRRILKAALRLWPGAARRRRAGEVLEHLDEEVRRRTGPRSDLPLSWAARTVAGVAWSGLRLRVSPAHGGAGTRGGRRREGWIMGIGNDAVQAARGLARAPRFTALVVVTLALGVGLDTALFSVVDRVLLRPLAYDRPDELVYVQARRDREGVDHALISGGDLKALRAVAAFEAVEGVANVRQNLTGAGLPRQVAVAWSSPGFLSMLGVRPAVGRLYGADDPPGTVVLSHGLWLDQFGGDPAVVGRGIQLDGYPHTVVGVLPPAFELRIPGRRIERRPELWKNPDTNWQNGDVWNAQGAEFGLLQVVARRTPEASLAAASEAVDAVAGRLRDEVDGYRDMGWGLSLSPLHERIVEDVRPSLLLLAGAVGLVLLIACANVANLLLVRAGARTRELALRKALGASRGATARLLLLESLLLAGGGALGGLALALPTLELLTRLAPAAVPLSDAFTLDARVAGFGVALAAFTTLAVGLVPAWRASACAPAADLMGSRGSTGGPSTARSGLVVVQVALTLVLLTGAGLLTGSLARLHAVDGGLDTDEIFTFSVSIPGARYDWPDEAGAFYRAVQERAAALPGVEAAGVVWPLPFTGSRWGGEATADADEPDRDRQADYFLATEEYFPAAGVDLLEGRAFRDGDPRHVVMVGRAFAEAAWPGGSAVGRTVTANPWGRSGEAFEVIGVVDDVRAAGLREAPTQALYFDARTWSWVDWEVDVVVRTATTPAALLPRLREAVAGLDPEVPVAEAAPLSEHLERDTAPIRFALTLLAVFAGAAGLLAFVGLYGVVAFTVGRRAREIGIRVALGADAAGIRRRFLGQGVRLTGAGVGLGLLLALGATRLLEGWLFEVEARDPGVFAAGVVTVGVAALLATWIPARRASRVDPVEVLARE